MNYEKLTFEGFKKKLASNGYQGGLTGARRAIGKTDWPEADKNKARALAEKHFGGAPAKTAAPKKVAAAKTTTVKKTVSAAPAKKAGRSPKAAAKKTTAKKASKKSAPSIETSPRASVEPVVAASEMPKPVEGPIPEHYDLSLVIATIGNKQTAGIPLESWELELYAQAGQALSQRLSGRQPVTDLAASEASVESTPSPVVEVQEEVSVEAAPPVVDLQPVAPPRVLTPASTWTPPEVQPPVPGTMLGGPTPISPTTVQAASTEPAVVLPKGLDPEGAASLPPEKRAQYELLAKAGEAVRRMALGPNGTPPTTT